MPKKVQKKKAATKKTAQSWLDKVKRGGFANIKGAKSGANHPSFDITPQERLICNQLIQIMEASGLDKLPDVFPSAPLPDVPVEQATAPAPKAKKKPPAGLVQRSPQAPLPKAEALAEEAAHLSSLGGLSEYDRQRVYALIEMNHKIIDSFAIAKSLDPNADTSEMQTALNNVSKLATLLEAEGDIVIPQLRRALPTRRTPVVGGVAQPPALPAPPTSVLPPAPQEVPPTQTEKRSFESSMPWYSKPPATTQH